MRTWDEIRNTIPTFIVNLDRMPDRLELAQSRIREAGFRNVHRFKAVDASSDDLDAAWAPHGSPHFGSDDSFTTNKGEQGCFLSHINLWQHMIAEELDMAVVFEDDVLFHTDWDALAPSFFGETPCDFDILFMGSQIENPSPTERVMQVPVYCTHAYIITQQGAVRLYNKVTSHDKGVRAIDCMLRDYMQCEQHAGFVWYAWNGVMHTDSLRGVNPHWVIRNSGLVYQDEKLGSCIKERE